MALPASLPGPGGSKVNVSYSGNSVIVSLSGVTDQQTVAVSTGNGSRCMTLSTSPSVSIGFLNGDVNFDRVVNVGDTIVTRSHAGIPVDATNFQFDVNGDGQIDVGDATIVRSKSGDYLP